MPADIKLTEQGYIIDGKIYPRVTSILSVIRKQELEQWRGEVGNEVADEKLLSAQDTGTRIHSACEDILEQIDAEVEIPKISNLDVYPENEQCMLLNFLGWAVKHIEKIILLEKVVYHPTYIYAGRMDWLVVLKGDSIPTLFDLKTSAAIYDEVALQLAAYKEALKVMGIVEDCRRMCLRLDKEDGSIQIKEFNGTQDFNAFLCCLGLYNWRKGGKNG